MCKWVAFGDAASGKVAAADAAAQDASASLRFAAVECEADIAEQAAVCNEFTAGGSLSPTVWCFANGNWTEGAPLRLSIESSNATVATASHLTTGSLLDFAVHCVATWAALPDEQIRGTRYVSSRAAQAEASMPPPGQRRRDLDSDKPRSTLHGMREQSNNAKPKKAVEMEYVPHVSENQGRVLPRSAMRRKISGDEDDFGGSGGGGGGKKIGSKKLKSSGPILETKEGGLPSAKALGADGIQGVAGAMKRVEQTVHETTEERRARRVKEVRNSHLILTSSS